MTLTESTPHHQPPDSELMRSYAAGDAAAFEQLYQRHRQALYQYFLNSCATEAEAAELFQEVWLRVINHRQRYQPAAPFNAWLYRIAKQRLVDHYRKNSRTPPHEQHEDNQALTDDLYSLQPLEPDAITQLVQQSEVLHTAMQALSPMLREAILLKHIAGMSLTEIADITETTAETIKSRLRYARVKLRNTLRKYV